VHDKVAIAIFDAGGEADIHHLSLAITKHTSDGDYQRPQGTAKFQDFIEQSDRFIRIEGSEPACYSLRERDERSRSRSPKRAAPVMGRVGMAVSLRGQAVPRPEAAPAPVLVTCKNQECTLLEHPQKRFHGYCCHRCQELQRAYNAGVIDIECLARGAHGDKCESVGRREIA